MEKRQEFSLTRITVKHFDSKQPFPPGSKKFCEREKTDRNGLVFSYIYIHLYHGIVQSILNLDVYAKVNLAFTRRTRPRLSHRLHVASLPDDLWLKFSRLLALILCFVKD